MAQDTWTLCLRKEAYKFSAAHFLIFPDGSAERLHGHNYQVAVRVSSQDLVDGVILDFRTLKNVVREIVDELDERLLVPYHNPHLFITQPDPHTTELRIGSKRYSVPSEDIRILDIDNTSVERLSSMIAHRLVDELRRVDAGGLIQAVEVSVEETSGQEARARVAIQPALPARRPRTVRGVPATMGS